MKERIAFLESNNEENLRPPSEENIVSLFYKLEKHILEIRKINDELKEVTQLNLKLKQDLATHQNVYERILKDKDIKLRELTVTENKNKTLLQEYNTQLHEQEQKIKHLVEQNQTYQNELTQYKAAWSEVLKREREAKEVLLECENKLKNDTNLKARINILQDKLEEEKKHNTQLEKTTKDFEQELQSSLIKYHQAQAEVAKLNKSIETLKEDKQNFAKDLMKDREQDKELLKRLIRAELESEMLLEREKLVTQTLDL
ncbi:MAG: hypothetical protein HY843_08445 [Bdellovibrio sp.]|nr:hypothetical protein [Bdellovibrio sp.]